MRRAAECASICRSPSEATVEGGEALLEHRRRLPVLLFGLRLRQKAACRTQLLRDLQAGVGVEGREASADLPIGTPSVRRQELVSKPIEGCGHGRDAAAEQREVRTEMREVEGRIAETDLVEVDHARPVCDEHVLV